MIRISKWAHRTGLATQFSYSLHWNTAVVPCWHSTIVNPQVTKQA